MIFCERGDRNKKKTGGGREAAIAKVIAHAGSADLKMLETCRKSVLGFLPFLEHIQTIKHIKYVLSYTYVLLLCSPLPDMLSLRLR